MPLIFAPHGGATTTVQPPWLQAWPKSHKPVPNSLQKQQCVLAALALSNSLTQSDYGTRPFSSSG